MAANNRNISSVLRMGTCGNLVFYLQKMLRVLEEDVEETGIYDEKMKQAVLRVQQKYALEADGIVGPKTWEKLFQVYRVPVTGTGIEKFIQTARYELSLGFKEDAASNITPYGEWYKMNRNPWCAMFVSWCAYQAGILNTIVPKYALCAAGAQWYRNHHRYFEKETGYISSPGDIVFFRNVNNGRMDHTGIVIDTDSFMIHTIEGNVGNAVSARFYPVSSSRIDGFGCNNF